MNKAMIAIPLADGAEEMEAVTIRDILQRAELDARFVALEDREITCARGARILPDMLCADVKPERLAAIVLPGGMGGTRAWMKFEPLHAALRELMESGCLVGAICATPMVLGAAGILAGRRYTCYPGCEEEITEGEWTDERVVKDGNLVTSKGPGTAVEFSLELVQILAGGAVMEQVARGLVWDR